MGDAQCDSVGAFAAFADLDIAAERGAADRVAQHRMGNARGLHRGDSEAGSDAGEPEQERKGQWPLAGEEGQRYGGQGLDLELHACVSLV